MDNELKELIKYYCKKDSAWGQSDLVDLLRAVQELYGGILTESVLEDICKKLDIKRSYLKTVMRFIPDLKTEDVCHRLEICGGKSCHSKGNAELLKYIERTYDVKSGGTSKKGKFELKTSGCMKNCKNGPCIKWDGEIYTKMNAKRLDQLIKK